MNLVAVAFGLVVLSSVIVACSDGLPHTFTIQITSDDSSSGAVRSSSQVLVVDGDVITSGNVSMEMLGHFGEYTRCEGTWNSSAGGWVLTLWNTSMDSASPDHCFEGYVNRSELVADIHSRQLIPANADCHEQNCYRITS